MKKLSTYLIFLMVLISLLNCSNDSSGSDEDEATKIQGTIHLSGDETSQFGTSLSVGNIEVGNANLTGTDKSVVLLSENITVKNDDFEYKSTDNGFVIVASDFSTGGSIDIDKAISMTIVKNGEEYRHACSSPYLGFFTACGENFSIDFDNKVLVLNQTTVINTETDAILTMAGTINW